MKKTFALLLALAALAAFATGCSHDNDPAAPALADSALDKAAGGADRMANYTITIENLTPATGPGASQPFSPPILASHRASAHVFRVGEMASDLLAGVAEDAMNGPLVDALGTLRAVDDVATGGGVILPGESMTLELAARPDARRLSAVFMLVNTNDAFGGLDSVKLPKSGSETFMVYAYDAGSEVNSESASEIPGPCCGNPGMGTAEGGYITMHQGITGTGDLDPATYGWEGAVARVTVQRVD